MSAFAELLFIPILRSLRASVNHFSANAEKEYKKSKKTNTLSNFNTGKNVKEEVLPDWFNQSIKKEEIRADDEKSLKDMLKEFS